MRRHASIAVALSLVPFALGAIGSMRAGAAPVQPAGAAPVQPAVAANVQNFTGGGTGTFSNNDSRGHYTSTSQLGAGVFSTEPLIVDGFPALDGSDSVTFTRSDGMVLGGTAKPGSVGCDLGPDCETVNLTGTADILTAHFFLAMNRDGAAFSFLMKGMLTLAHRSGYVMVGTDGTVYPFGGIDNVGNAPQFDTRATDIELTPTHRGYWIVNDAGTVSAFGDARSFSNGVPAVVLPGERVTSISATPTGNGYWLFTSKGRAVPFGDAHFFGDMHTTPLNGPIVGSVATPTGKGYYMVGSDGGIFAFGDAIFRGSMGGTHLNAPVVGLVPTADNSGYWLVASDGGVFSFDAAFHGSMGGTPLNRPVVSMVPYGDAYLMVAADGGVFNFSYALFFGSLAGAPLSAPITTAAAAS